MRGLALFAIAAVICCLPELSLAEADGNGVAPTNVRFTKAIADALMAAAQQPTADRAEWQVRMDAAQDRRSRGVRYVFVGLGVAVAGTVFTAAAAPDTVFDDHNDGLRLVGVLTALGGGGIFWYGIYHWVSGSNEVDNLDREGRANGFLSLAPVSGGVRLAVNLTF